MATTESKNSLSKKKVSHCLANWKSDACELSFAKPLTDVFLSLTDRPFVSGGQSSSAYPVVTANDEERPEADAPSGSPLSLDDLLSRSVPARCGKGTETVTDVTIRKTRRISNPADVNIEWRTQDDNGTMSCSESPMVSILNEIHTATGQLQSTRLSAQLHDVLLYSPGDFFLEHRDSKKCDEHLMTLVIQCSVASGDEGEEQGVNGDKYSGGGISFFCDVESRVKQRYRRSGHSDDDDEERESNEDLIVVDEQSSRESEAYDKRRRRLERKRGARRVGAWSSTVAGSWCAWYTTQRHAVEPITSGNRVVVVYNILAHSASVSSSLPILEKVSDTIENFSAGKINTTTSSLLSLPSEVIRGMSLYLSVSATQTLRVCSHFLCNTLNPNELAEARLRELQPQIIKELKSVNKENKHIGGFGFVLWHPYSTDGKPTVDPKVLRGRDLTFVRLMSSVLGKMPKLFCCEVLVEVPDERYADTYPTTVRNVHVVRELLKNTPLLPTPGATQAQARAAMKEYQALQVEWRKMPESDRNFTNWDCEENIPPIAVKKRFPWANNTTKRSSTIHGGANGDLLLGCSLEYLAFAHVAKGTQEYRWEELWGNNATFDLYWYKTTMAVF